MTELNSEAPGCFGYPERDFLADGGTVLQLAATDPQFVPGYRFATLGDVTQVQVYYNMETPPQDYLGIWTVEAGYTGAVDFHSRPNGRYCPDCSYQYAMSVPGGVARCLQVDGGACTPTPWAPAQSQDGSFDAWVDELYDGIMWQFMPSTPDLGTRCMDTTIVLPAQQEASTAWRVGP